MTRSAAGVAANARTGLGGIQRQGHGVEVKTQLGFGFEKKVIALNDGELTNGLTHQFTEFHRPAQAADDPRRERVQHGPPFRPQAPSGFHCSDGLAG